MYADIQNGWLIAKNEPHAAPNFMIRLDAITAIARDTEQNNPVLKIQTAQQEYKLYSFGNDDIFENFEPSDNRWASSDITFRKIQQSLLNLNITEKQNRGDEDGINN